MKICKTFTFDAAHKLPDYEGVCKNLHGHHYILKIILEGRINKETGMIVDFKEISDIVKKYIYEHLDHTYLNDYVSNPTAENLVREIYWDVYKEILNKYANIINGTIRLYETPTSWVEYDGTD